jgi:outer membrane protein OmpA-like peptidoglycan-associated protein
MNQLLRAAAFGIFSIASPTPQAEQPDLGSVALSQFIYDNIQSKAVPTYRDTFHNRPFQVNWPPLLTAANSARPQQQTSGSSAKETQIRLVKGTTIVTAIRDRSGDFESIKQIDSASSGGIHISYSISSRGDRAYRYDSARDLATAQTYDQSFNNADRKEIRPGSTALGISSALLRTLKEKGSVDASIHSLHDNRLLPGRFDLVEAQDVSLPVSVNDVQTDLPAVHARGSFVESSGEFWFLDEPDAPITLMYHIDERVTSDFQEWQELRVVQIATPGVTEQRILQELKTRNDVILHGIYFDFDKATIRAESEPVIAAIADALEKNPSWHITIAGHTDNTGDPIYNLDLSKRRADAVAQELTRRYNVDAKRLSTVGFGARRPKVSNDTPEGRAYNRRVELSRT